MSDKWREASSRMNPYNEKMAANFRQSVIGSYSLNYARAVFQASPNGSNMIPKVLLGDSWNGLRDKRQTLEHATCRKVLTFTAEEMVLFETLGSTKWLRPLLNAILADLIDYSKFVSRGGDKASKEGLELAARIPAALIEPSVAQAVEEAVSSRKDVQRYYESGMKHMGWSEMEDLVQRSVISVPKKFVKLKGRTNSISKQRGAIALTIASKKGVKYVKVGRKRNDEKLLKKTDLL